MIANSMKFEKVQLALLRSRALLMFAVVYLMFAILCANGRLVYCVGFSIFAGDFDVTCFSRVECRF